MGINKPENIVRMLHGSWQVGWWAGGGVGQWSRDQGVKRSQHRSHQPFPWSPPNRQHNSHQHNPKMREIVHIQAGQCGNQIGAKVRNIFVLFDTLLGLSLILSNAI